MTATLNLITATPAQIDTAWAEATAPLLDRIARAIAKRNAAHDLFAKKTAAEEQGRSHYASYSWDRIQTQKDEGYAAEEAARAELFIIEQPFNAEWVARGTWARAYKVTNGNGHIHSSMGCSTCNNGQRPTEFYWFTELSGHTTDEIADLAGEAACTVCYPNAPVAKPCSIFTPAEKATQAEREAKAAKLAAKQADAATKAITDVDGQPLRDHLGFVIKTERTARIDLVDALVSIMEVSGPWMLGNESASEESKAHWIENIRPKYVMTADRLTKAIAAKTGETFEEVNRTAMAKADKKWAKALKDWAKSPYNPANA